MNPYIQKLKDQLSQTMPAYGEDVTGVLEMLYSVYRERQSDDSAEMKQCFARLDKVLEKLTLKEYDMVWDVACVLCRTVEKEAFLEGIRMGAVLAEELGE